MSGQTFLSHLDADGHQLLGALFLTYGFDANVFEERVLPAIFALRHPPGEARFAEEARRRLAEVPVTVVADASCLEQADLSTRSGCGVPVVRFDHATGAFHPKLALLAYRKHGVRVVIGSANLTEPGLMDQIELVASFWLNEHPSAVSGLKRVLRALEARLAKSPAYARAAKLVERYFPAAEASDGDVAVLCSTAPILDQVLSRIDKATDGKGRVEQIAIVSPFFERGNQERSLLDEVVRRIRKFLPSTKTPKVVLTMSTKSGSAPYRVEAPVDRLVAFSKSPETMFECRVLTPEHRSWETEPGEPGEHRPRTLHGKLLVFRVVHAGSTLVFSLVGSPNFTKAALLGGNFEIALLQCSGKALPGIELPSAKVDVEDLIEDERAFGAPPRETACIDRVVMSMTGRWLEVIAAEGKTIPDGFVLRVGGKEWAWTRDGDGVRVAPFYDPTCRVVEVRFTEAWFELPVEVVDPEIAPITDQINPSLDELLARSAAYARDPDGVGQTGSRRTSGRGSRSTTQAGLTSIVDVAPRLEAIRELGRALETSLVDAATAEAMTARFRTYFAPTLNALARNEAAEAGTWRARGFALLDAQRAVERLARVIKDKHLRSALEQIEVESADIVLRFALSLGAGRKWFGCRS